MAIAFRITGWDDHFENNRTRDLKSLTWIPVPNKHDGDGFTDLLSDDDGVTHFGVWILILQVASKCEPRGTLLRDGGRPHDYASLSRMTRAQTQVIESAVARLLTIGWIELYDIDTKEVVSMSHAGAVKPQFDATESHDGAAFLNGKKGIEGKTEDSSEPPKPAASEPAVFVFPTNGKSKTWNLCQSKIDEYGESYPGVDVLAELRQALQWCRDNPRKRKTADGMPSFLTRWFSKAQNGCGGNGNGRAPPQRDDPRGNLAAMKSFLDDLPDDS